MALEEEFEYLCKLYSCIELSHSLFLFSAFRCAYCNYLNGARKNKPVFNPNVFSPPLPPPVQNGHNHVERMEMSITDSSDSTEPINEARLTRRSIRIPKPDTDILPRNPDLSSSEESLSEKKN